MNTIEFKIVKNHDQEWSGEYNAVRIFIDNKDLIDILRDFELEFAKKENNEDIAGAYGGMSPESIYENLTSKPNAENNKTVILECDCACSGCWDLLVEIIETEDEIIWTNFENIHRGPQSHNFWDYSSFKNFSFDKKAYYIELEKLKKLS